MIEDENNKLKYSDSPLILYPSIFSKELKIILNPFHHPLSVKLFDSRGNLVQNIFTGIVKKKKELTFNPRRKLSPGIYFITLNTDKEKVLRKVIYLGK